MLHHILKDSTHEQHERLHHHPLLEGLGTGQVSRAEWLRALQAFHCFYSHYETEAQQYAGMPNAPVLKWITHDFLTAGAAVPLALEGECTLVLEDISALAGYLYVKQGSTLGGQIISKRLRQSLGLVGGEDQCFFYGYGPQTGERWKDFLAWLADSADQINPGVAANVAQTLFAELASICDRIYAQEEICPSRT